MDSNYTDISIVLDRSGSMNCIRSATIENFNKFLTDQKNLPNKATITLIQFDDKYESNYEGMDLQNAYLLTNETYVPRGMTALLDAIGKTIISTGNRLKNMNEMDRPGKIVFVILTDGLENASTEFSVTRIKEMIEHQQNMYKWEFVFLGANQDAILTAKIYGINTNNAYTFDATIEGSQIAVGSLSVNMINYRSGHVATMAFSEEDRKKQEMAGK